jgi:DNA processing protein
VRYVLTVASEAEVKLIPGRKDHEIGAIVALLRSAVVPADRLGAAIDHLGSAVTLVERVARGELLAFLESQGSLTPLPPAEISRALAEAASWLDEGFDIRTVLDPDYPRPLHEIFNRPPLVFLRGRWREDRDLQSIAVVGTRRPTPDGARRARKLTRELVEAQFTIVSGLASGIDTAAHETALAGGGRTIAVVGTGLGRVYPPANAGLAERIVDAGGAILSQFFPEQPPTRWTFPKRNVVMSGLSQATVVVEAGATSGARMQARIALEHGRSVFLLRSLVAAHDWARKYVEEGAYQTRAIEIGSTAEILDCLAGGRAAVDLAV